VNRQWTALIFLLGSTFCTLVVAIFSLWIWKNYRNDQLTNERYRITSIIQTGPEKEALQTAYLAELLHLSQDVPTQLYVFDIKQGEERLLKSPLIKKAHIKRLPPCTLYIDYEVRKPVSYLGDFRNTGIDREGYIFPIEPFFAPKRLPEIYLGLTAPLELPIKDAKFDLALGVLKLLETAPWEEGLQIIKIDVSHAFSPSLGQREVILSTEEEVTIQHQQKEMVCVFPKIIRLSPKDYTHQLENFFQLQKTILNDYRRQLSCLSQGGRFAPRTVDLRIPQLAFVER